MLLRSLQLPNAPSVSFDPGQACQSPHAPTTVSAIFIFEQLRTLR